MIYPDKMKSVDLEVTDLNGIDGIVTADYDSDGLQDFEVVSSDDADYSPKWSQVESSLEAKLHPWDINFYNEHYNLNELPWQLKKKKH